MPGRLQLTCGYAVFTLDGIGRACPLWGRVLPRHL